MNYRFHRFLVLVLLSFMVVACATTPVSQNPDSKHIATAKQFVQRMGIGELSLAMFRRQMEIEAKAQPDRAELARQAFTDIHAEDFEDMAARAYARHLTHRHLTELTTFSERQVGSRFFRMMHAVLIGIVENKPIEIEEMMRQFNDEEIAEITKFTQSEAFVAMKQAQPAINREMAEEGRQFGEAKLRAYLTQQ